MWKQEVNRKTWKKLLTLVAFGDGKCKCEVRCICSTMALNFGYTCILFKLKKLKMHICHTVWLYLNSILCWCSIFRTGLMKVVLNKSAPWKFLIGCECYLIDSCLVKRQFYLREYRLNQSSKVACEQETIEDKFCLVHSVVFVLSCCCFAFEGDWMLYRFLL